MATKRKGGAAAAAPLTVPLASQKDVERAETTLEDAAENKRLRSSMKASLESTGQYEQYSNLDMKARRSYLLGYVTRKLDTEAEKYYTNERIVNSHKSNDHDFLGLRRKAWLRSLA